ESRKVASVKSATRCSASSRACSPASARQPAPKVKVGMPTVNARSLSSVKEKSAWQHGILGDSRNGQSVVRQESGARCCLVERVRIDVSRSGSILENHVGG